jgi:LacI family transcriptional regulator
MSVAKRKRRRVALMVETSRAYGRGVLQGISKSLQDNSHWSVRLQDRGLNDPLPEWLRRWSLDGIIARIETQQLADSLHALAVPVVNLSGIQNDPRFPIIDTDDSQVADLAFQHFAERGFRNLAFCGYPGASWSDTRLIQFEQRARAAGLSFQNFQSRPVGRKASATFTLAYETRALAHDRELIAWLKTLPIPSGILAANDLRGQQLLGLCQELSIRVPDQLAILGVDDDELMCELTDPPLSSVQPDCERIGQTAASALELLMHQPRRRTEDQLISPLGVGTRQSTEVLAIEDPLIVKAVRFIRENACSGITVPDILRVVPLSRSGLERGFGQYLGRAPKAEILRLKLERARELLRDTDLPLAEISTRCGFRHPEYFSSVFRDKVGVPPGRFRRSRN